MIVFRNLFIPRKYCRYQFLNANSDWAQHALTTTTFMWIYPLRIKMDTGDSTSCSFSHYTGSRDVEFVDLHFVTDPTFDIRKVMELLNRRKACSSVLQVYYLPSWTQITRQGKFQADGRPCVSLNRLLYSIIFHAPPYICPFTQCYLLVLWLVPTTVLLSMRFGKLGDLVISPS